MRRWEIEVEEMKDRACESLSLAQGQVEDFSQQQAAVNGCIGVLCWPAAAGGLRGAEPMVNGGLIKPEGETSARSEG